MSRKIPVKATNKPVVTGSHGQRLLTSIQKRWHNFRVQNGPDQSGVLCANTNLYHKKYRGVKKQGAAVAMVCCAYAKLRKMEQWTGDTLDDILKMGTLLYLKTMEVLKKKCVEYIEPPDLVRYFFIGDVYVTMALDVEKVAGTLRQDAQPLDQLKSLVQAFFRTSKHSGICSVQNRYFALWLYQDGYFLFNPLEHSEDGSRWSGILGLGFGCAFRFRSTALLAEYLYTNLTREHAIRVVIYACDVEKVKIVDRKPPEDVPDKKPVGAAVKIHAKPKPKEPQQLHKPVVKEPEEPKAEEGKNQPEGDVPQNRIPPQRPKLASVTNFLAMGDNGLGVLRASTHQNDAAFTSYAGAQELANAVAAVTMLRFAKSKRWTHTIVDGILRLGEAIHREALQKTPYDVPAKVSWEGRDFAPELKRMEALGRLQSASEDRLDLLPALRQFFFTYDCCIVKGPLVVAVWVEDGTYYMFDPNERDALGKSEQLGEGGKACVTFYKQLPELVKTYFCNIRLDRSRDYFRLYRVKIKDHVAKPEDWYEFKALAPQRWILRGHFSQNNPRFERPYRNVQCTANATMAVVYSHVKEEKEWTRDTIDSLLVRGHDYYVSTRQMLEAEGRYRDPLLMCDELSRHLAVDDKRINLEIDDCLINGMLRPHPNTSTMDLRRGFEAFFHTSTAGVVTASSQSVGLWKRGDCYYYYDSHSRDETGIRTSPYGTACLLRIVSLTQLADAVLSNLSSGDYFNISRLVVNIVATTEDGAARPPLNNFAEIDAYRAILRSNGSELSRNFDRLNRGKQTIPMLLTALVLNTVRPVASWNPDLLDQILKRGDKHFVKCMELIRRGGGGGDGGLDENDEVTTDNVIAEMSFGTNRFYMTFEEYSMGTFDENFAATVEGFLGDGGNQGILESQYQTVALWKDENVFYVFDSKARDALGQAYGKDEWTLLPPPEEQGEDQAGVEGEDKEGADDVDKEGTEDEEEKKFEDGTNPELDRAILEAPDELYEDLGEHAPAVEKKGSAYWQQRQEQEGRACIVRFGRLADLITHIVENIPPTKRQELPYSLKTVTVTNTPNLREVYQPGQEDKKDEWAGDWHNFQEIDYGKWIIRGTKNNTDAVFLPANRGKQSIPMCLNALVFVHLYALSQFKAASVDHILLYGDRLYTWAMKRKAEEMKRDFGLSDDGQVAELLSTVHLKPRDYPKKLKLSERSVGIEVRMDKICGDITSSSPDEVATVQSGLEQFFATHRTALLECKQVTVAVWKQGGVFYMFDACARNPRGGRSQTGNACITRFKNLEDLSALYLGNLHKFGPNFFSIHEVLLTEDKTAPPTVEERKVKERLENLGGYSEIVPGKEILRGSVKQDADNFIGGVHMQSAAIAFVTLGLSLVNKPETWTHAIVDEVLAHALGLYFDSIDSLGARYHALDGPLDVARILSDFPLGSQRASCVLRPSDVKGIVDVKNKAPAILNLRQGLEAFFRDNSHGILFAHNLVLPIWEEERENCVRNIYIYDPNQRGPTGLPQPGGVACVMKFVNEKMAADHVTACLLGVDKTQTGYSIRPVEIVCGKCRSKKHKHAAVKCQPPVKTTCPSRCEEEAQKRKLRHMMEEERRKKEQKRHELLGRAKFHEISKDEAILRGTSRLKDGCDITSNLTAFLLMRTHPIDRWTCKNIDQALTTGQQLYIDSCLTYKTKRIGLTNVLRKFLILDKYQAEVGLFKPIICSGFTPASISAYLDKFFGQGENFCLVNYRTSWTSVFFTGGFYYYFDPYRRNVMGLKDEEAGTAIVMRFGDLTVLGAKMAANLREESDENDRFFLVKVTLKSLVRMGGAN